MVICEPSSGLLLVVELLSLLPPHAPMLSAMTATAATLRGPRQRLPDAISSPLTKSAVALKDLQFLQPDRADGVPGHEDPDLAGHDRFERHLIEVRCRRGRRRHLVGHV